MTFIVITNQYSFYFRNDAYPTLHIPNPSEHPPKRRRLVRQEPSTRHERHLATELSSIVLHEEMADPNNSAVPLMPSADINDSPPLIVSASIAGPSIVKEVAMPSSDGTKNEQEDHAIQVKIPDPSLKKARNVERQLRRNLHTAVRRNLSLSSYCKRLRSQLDAVVKRMDAMVCKRCRVQKRLPEHTQVFIEEQMTALTKQGRGMRWSSSTVKIGQFLMYKSPSCYRRLQSFFNLPSPSTLYRKSAKVSSEVSWVSLCRLKRLTILLVLIITYIRIKWNLSGLGLHNDTYGNICTWQYTMNHQITILKYMYIVQNDSLYYYYLWRLVKTTTKTLIKLILF